MFNARNRIQQVQVETNEATGEVLDKSRKHGSLFSLVSPILLSLPIASLWWEWRTHEAQLLVVLGWIAMLVQFLLAPWFSNNWQPTTPHSSYIFIWMLIIVFKLQMLIYSTFLALALRNSLPKLVHLLKQNLQTFSLTDHRHVRNRIIMEMAATSLMHSVNAVLFILVFMGDGNMPLMDSLHEIVIDLQPKHWSFNIMNSFLNTSLVFVWISPKALSLPLCRYLTLLHQKLTDDVEQAIKHKTLKKRLRLIISDHNILGQAVLILDSALSPMVAVCCIGGVVLECANLYVTRLALVGNWMSGGLLMAVIYWVVVVTLDIYQLAWIPAKLCESIHGPLVHLHGWQPPSERALDEEDVKDFELQLSLFVSKLSGPRQGITFCGIFVVTKEFILTLMGIVVTYFVLMIQFNF